MDTFDPSAPPIPVDHHRAAPPSVFGRLPRWAKILFVLLWPLSISYAIYRMWRTGSLSQPARVALTAAGIVLMIVLWPKAQATTQIAEPPVSPASVAESPVERATTPPIVEAAEPEPAPEPEPEPVIVAVAAKVTRIVDGDTIHVEMPDGATEKVRFIGVDSPEPTTESGTFGDEATEFTATALSGKTVFLETDVELRDKYDRLLAHIWLDMPDAVNDTEIREHLFNAHLLLAGYANLLTIPPDVKYVDYLKGYENEARSASLGLWAPAPVVAAAPEPTRSKPTAAAYIGNKNTRKFHFASCRSVGQMNPSNKVPYSSREDAVADGYVPCKNCNP